jgi:hypothetical protein
MRKNRIQFLKIQCKGGCGKELITTSRSIHGLDALHAKYAGYCSVCSPLNEHEIALKQGQALVDKFVT